MSAPRDQQHRFLSTVTGWLLSLPHDLRILFEAKDEPNLDRAARETAAGAILYVLNPDKVSGEEPFVGFADDTILVRLALRKILQQGGEGSDAYKERFSEHYTSLDSDLTLMEQVMGSDTFGWLVGKCEGLAKQSYKGKKVPQYIDEDESAELLYEDGLAFGSNYPLDEGKLSMRLKRPETLLEPLHRKAHDEKKKTA